MTVTEYETFALEEGDTVKRLESDEQGTVRRKKGTFYCVEWEDHPIQWLPRFQLKLVCKADDQSSQADSLS